MDKYKKYWVLVSIDCKVGTTLSLVLIYLHHAALTVPAWRQRGLNMTSNQLGGTAGLLQLTAMPSWTPTPPRRLRSC